MCGRAPSSRIALRCEDAAHPGCRPLPPGPCCSSLSRVATRSAAARARIWGPPHSVCWFCPHRCHSPASVTGCPGLACGLSAPGLTARNPSCGASASRTLATSGRVDMSFRQHRLPEVRFRRGGLASVRRGARRSRVVAGVRFCFRVQPGSLRPFTGTLRAGRSQRDRRDRCLCPQPRGPFPPPPSAPPRSFLRAQNARPLAQSPLARGFGCPRPERNGKFRKHFTNFKLHTVLRSVRVLPSGAGPPAWDPRSSSALGCVLSIPRWLSGPPTQCHRSCARVVLTLLTNATLTLTSLLLHCVGRIILLLISHS